MVSTTGRGQETPSGPPPMHCPQEGPSQAPTCPACLGISAVSAAPLPPGPVPSSPPASPPRTDEQVGAVPLKNQ